jgi:hypothetical protein
MVPSLALRLAGDQAERRPRVSIGVRAFMQPEQPGDEQ